MRVHTALPGRCRVAAVLPLCVLGGALLSGSCAVHQGQDDYSSSIDLPAAYRNFSPDEGVQTSPVSWWEAFGDPGLVRMVEDVLRGNPGLEQAWSRLLQAEAAAREAGAFRSAEMSAEASGSRSRTRLPFGSEEESTTNIFSLSLGAAYEVDLWRRLASRQEAALYMEGASRDDFESLAMTLTSRTAEAWFSLGEVRQQIALQDSQTELAVTALEILELRFSLGQAPAVEVLQQRQQLASLQAQLPPLEARRRTLQHLLHLLRGVPPEQGRPDPEGGLPDLPPPPAVGVPSDLLLRRPDVRAAHQRLLAADRELASSMADLLPSLRLSGGGGFQGESPGEIFSSLVYQLASSLAGPLLDGGRREAAVQKKRALLAERLHRFREAVITAMVEVEDALVIEERRREELLQRQRLKKISESTLDQARLRYSAGVDNYLPVILARSALYGNERAIVALRRDVALSRVALYRALGGDWSAGLSGGGEAVILDSEGDL